MAGHNNNERRQSGWFGAPNLFMTPPPNPRPQPPPNTRHDDDGTGSRSGGGAVSGGRRPHGRPLGSKNKPKSPPIMVMKENPHALYSHLLEVSSGADIMKTLIDYSRRRAMGVCILSGKGMVSQVTLRQPGSPAGTVVTLRGRFEILCISGTVLPRPPAPQAAIAEGLSVYLSGGQGQIVGGVVVAPLITWGPVFLMAGTFFNVVFERLPLALENRRQPPSSASHSFGVASTGHVAEGGGNAPLSKRRNIPISSSFANPGGNLFG